MQRENTIRIPPEETGLPLLDFVSRRFTYRNREEWRKELAAGRFTLNQGTAGAEDLLTAGDLLSYRMEELPEPPVDFRFTIIYEDADLLAVNKPAPLPCHPGGRFFHHTLWARLKEDCGIDHPAFINRLDRETSGVVLLAKNREAARHCQDQFRNHSVAKLYLVLVEGDFPAGEIMAAGWLAPAPESLIRKKVRFIPSPDATAAESRQCSTSFRLLARENSLSLLEARPHTGRCHQIRATLSCLGFPVVGDKLYGVDERLFLRMLENNLTPADHQRLRLPRQALHAACLRLIHPATGRQLSFSAPLPPAFSATFPQAGAHWR